MEASKSSPRTIMIRIRIRIFWQGWEDRAMNHQSLAINKRLKVASLVQRQLPIVSVPTSIRIVIQSPQVQRRKVTAALGLSQEALSELELVGKAATSYRPTALPIFSVPVVTAMLLALDTYSRPNSVSICMSSNTKKPVKVNRHNNKERVHRAA